MSHKIQQEIVGDEIYAYYPLGKYVVRAPGICGGRPTFKYTRIEVGFILNRLMQGKSIDYIVDAYADSNLSHAAIQEALSLANAAFMALPEVSQPLAA
ncbi:MAG: DUF433 domain-containing protein [Caldilineaceae bacterium]